MLYLLFQLGGERYVLEANQVVEVLPLVEARPIPRAPAGVAGVFNYRGAPVPLIDLSELALGRPSQQWLSTRIVLVRSTEFLVGLITERATETLRCDPADFVASPINAAGAPYLGAVASDDQGLLQRLELDRLLTHELRALLAAEHENTTDDAD